ncbi:MAG: response regulator transcription factor [Tepidiformaceae bacterium]
MWSSSGVFRGQGWGSLFLPPWPGPGSSAAREAADMTGTDARPFVLVIDRLPGVVTLVQLALISRNFHVATATEQAAARALLLGESPGQGLSSQDGVAARPDVALIGVTGGDIQFGVEAARMVREVAPDIPIVLLTSTESAGIARGRIQADAEVAAPWDLDTLEFRLRVARLRSAERRGTPEVLVFGSLRVDLQERFVTREGAPISLAGPEWRLLEILALVAGEPVRAEALLEGVWGPSYRDDLPYLNAWMARLNRKLGESVGTEAPLVKMVAGGYVLREADPS